MKKYMILKISIQLLMKFVEILKIIVTNNLDVPSLKILFTTDLRQNSETLQKSLIEIKTDEATGKYKMEEMNLKILG